MTFCRSADGNAPPRSNSSAAWRRSRRSGCRERPCRWSSESSAIWIWPCSIVSNKVAVASWRFSMIRIAAWRTVGVRFERLATSVLPSVGELLAAKVSINDTAKLGAVWGVMQLRIFLHGRFAGRIGIPIVVELPARERLRKRPRYRPQRPNRRRCFERIAPGVCFPKGLPALEVDLDFRSGTFWISCSRACSVWSDRATVLVSGPTLRHALPRWRRLPSVGHLAVVKPGRAPTTHRPIEHDVQPRP